MSARPIDPVVLDALASMDEIVGRASQAWRPPPALSLSEWADEYFYLSAESSAQPGKWSTLPYQKGIMDAFTDRTVTHVSVMKSARVGWTKIVNALIGYSIHQDPCPILVVQPTIEDAKGYSKEEIDPMLRDSPALAEIVIESKDEESAIGKQKSDTILHKKFPGGVLAFVGANSGAGFRRVSRKRVLFDEVDAYPPSAGDEGDPVKLGTKRADYYWDRKIGAGSTPLIAGVSRIEQLYKAGTQERFYVPCPHCGHFDYLVFRENTTTGEGHFMQWPEGKPEEAHFVCSLGGCVIEHKDKRTMVAAGDWRQTERDEDDPPLDLAHRSFHIWAAYSFSPNAAWGQLAKEFVETKGDREKLKTFINTALGETWKEQGEAPDWERLYARRETYEIGKVAAGVRFLTAGVDVQKDRFVYEVVGWGVNKESWSIDAGVLPAETADLKNWAVLDGLLNSAYERVDGEGSMSILMLAVDSGYNTQNAYNWGRAHERNRVIATKGVAGARTMLVPPTPVDVQHKGQRIARGYKVWPLGVDIAKAELYGWLRLVPETTDAGAVYPQGYAHFPEHAPEFFKQLTAEILVTVVNKRTHQKKTEWQALPNRENHYLDCRIYARAAAAIAGLDRLKVAPRPAPPPVQPAVPTPAPGVWNPAVAPPVAAAAPSQQRLIRDSTFLKGRGRGWFTRR